MNCWFCNNPINLTSEDYQEAICLNEICNQHKVKYRVIKDKLIVTQFRTQLNNRAYIINYWVPNEKFNIVEQTLAPLINDPKDPYNYEILLELDSNRQILTPNNVKDKLPLLLLLS